MSLEEKDDSRAFSETTTLEEGRGGSEDHVKMPPSPGAGGAEMSLSDFWNYCKNEVPMDTKHGFFTLALLYALINNTVCRLRSMSTFATKVSDDRIISAYKLADPGTIQLLMSSTEQQLRAWHISLTYLDALT